VRGDGVITADLARQALELLNVDAKGLDALDRRLLDALLHKFDGGPVGIDSLAVAVGEERGTLEDVIEPYLVQEGLMQRTPRGRIATRAAWTHLGLRAPQKADLFVDE
jgi:Holliday junction DNA helicase RuvB